MTCPPDKNTMPPRPSLSVDWEAYAAMLEDSDMPLDQQARADRNPLVHCRDVC